VPDDVPERLTPAEAVKLTAWLNFAARKWPRLVGTLALQRVAVDLREFAADPGPSLDEPYRPPMLYGTGPDGYSVGFAELLTAAFPVGAVLFPTVGPAGTTFETRGLH